MWSKFDDQFYMNPKCALLDRDEQDIYFASIIYANGQLTDGFIPSSVLMMLYTWAKIPFEAIAQANAQAIASRLVEHSFWELVEGGYQIHDFLEWNPSRAEVLATRAERSEAGSRGGRRSAEIRKALAQANALASAQAKSKQNSTPSPSPSPSPLLPNEGNKKIEVVGAATPAYIPPSQEEMVYRAVTNRPTIPPGEVDATCHSIAAIQRANGYDSNQAVDYLRPFWTEFKKRYPRNTRDFWLTEWAVTGIIPDKSNGTGKHPGYVPQEDVFPAEERY